MTRLVARARRRRWPRSPRAAWLVLRRGDRDGRAAQRAGARADDGVAHALRPAPQPARPGHPRARARRASASCAACARTTRRARSATRCSTSARSPASATCGRPRAASRRGIDPWRPAGEVSDAEALAIVRRVPAAHAALGARRQPEPLPAHLRHGRPPVPALRPGARGSRRAARATTTARPTGARHVRRDAAPRRPQGRRPHRARQHDGVVRRRAGRRRRHDRVRRAARGPPRARDAPAVLAHDYEHVPPDALTLEQGLAHLASRRVRRRRARRRPQAARLRAARGRGAAPARAGRAHDRLHAVHAQPRRAARARAAAAARLVGAARAARLHRLAAHGPARLRAAAAHAPPAARRSPPRTCARAAATR